MQVKDASIQAFAQAFIGDLDTSDETDFFDGLRNDLQQNLAQQASFCTDQPGSKSRKTRFMA